MLNVLEPELFQGTVQECSDEELHFQVASVNGVVQGQGRNATLQLERRLDLQVCMRKGNINFSLDYSFLQVMVILQH